ncbi:MULTISPECIES: dioxygenase family protein [Streptomyces]|uniref:Hydroxyquinol 1,2-dioxygenase n=1 Tax=Streptomyces spinosisporus TaxID=2927582 RepID=A0ABS9XC29_9ACTN|nr:MULTISPECIES: dioxygenase [Streptomyces]MCI3238911.1 hydroxyquinol 1,2-dioxygenase [Streptomyces spinosisporus]WUB34711.1 hydroxyquinol 1,2-dioxygenase [Streptomyces sp. NBC_00588]
MSIDLTEETITAAVLQTFDGCADERMRNIFKALVQHLHDFTREVRLTGEEWFTAVDFLERVGRISSPTRQEFVLLSDILGLSVLVDQINHGNGSATDSTLLGPFFVEGRPRARNGADISGDVPGMPLFFTGTVINSQGEPVAGAAVDTWHSDGDGYYDVQQADKLHGEPAMRALLTTDDDGRFWYRSIVPRYYPVPTDGPCGEILRAADRSPMRPEHIHFWFHAENHVPLVTMLFRADDPYLERDAVFGAKRSLVADFVQHEAGEKAPDGTVMTEPFQTVEWTFVLLTAEDG